MRDGFESYRTELEGVRLTAESKDALKASLRSRARENGPVRRTRRLSAGVGRGIAAAAVLCLLSAMTAATVAAVGDPSLRGIISGDSAGYDQSSGIIGRSIEDGGWTVSITDCVGDESYCYIGVEVEAPEGTVLDGDYYLMNAEFDSDMLHKGNGGGRDSLLRPLPDDDPTDNKVRMVYAWSELGAGLSGARVRLRLTNFYEQLDYDWEAHDWNKEYLCYGQWDFGWMTVNFADNVRHIPLEEDLPIEGGDGLLLVDEVAVSPLGSPSTLPTSRGMWTGASSGLIPCWRRRCLSWTWTAIPSPSTATGAARMWTRARPTGTTGRRGSTRAGRVTTALASGRRTTPGRGTSWWWM